MFSVDRVKWAPAPPTTADEIDNDKRASGNLGDDAVTVGA